MASVSSLDQDMRKLRLSRYTPQAASEVRTWIESTLHEPLPSGDLISALKDGVALCKLANLLLPPPGIKHKKSPMPFMQMENISHFLRACEEPPINLPAHDRFLTVDLYESKDPAQVLQCLGAFSRIANTLNPTRFPTTIGPKRGAGAASPALPATNSIVNGGGLSTAGEHEARPRGPTRGPSNTSASSMSTTSTAFPSLSRPPPSAARALSPTLTGDSVSTTATSSADTTHRSPPGPVSSWSKKTDETSTAPAWNIHQYGYMGGASQGNQGVAFGARRQITSAAPSVPSLAEKERRRREQEAEAERLRIQAEEAERQRRAERQAEEERERIEEERRWEEETRRLRLEEKARVEQQKREWEAQERRWRDEEEARVRADKEAQARVEAETKRKRADSDARLRGQFLSEYHSEQSRVSSDARPTGQRKSSYREESPSRAAERERMRELERQLEEAKERERQYQLEREERLRQDLQDRQDSSNRAPAQRTRSRSRSPSKPDPPPRAPSPQESQASWVIGGDERDFLRQQWQHHNQQDAAAPIPSRPLPDPNVVPPPPPKDPPATIPTSSRPLPAPPSASAQPQPAPRAQPPQPTPRTATLPLSPSQPRVAPFNPPSAAAARSPPPFGSPRPSPLTAGGTAAPQKPERFKSLLEREMERERERQREWEEAQMKSIGANGSSSGGGGGGGGLGGGRMGVMGPRPRP